MTRVVIGGKLAPELTPAQTAAISPYRREARVAGKVMAEDEAAAAYLAETRQLFALLAGVVLVLSLAVGLLAPPGEEATTYSFIVAANLLLWLFLFFLLRRRISAWNAAAGGRGSGLPPRGSLVVVADKGLEVAGRLHPWPALRIDQVDLADHSARGVPRYLIERLSLATASEVVVLDAMMIGNGRLIVGNTWRRLHAGQ
jgi:hypothetical protein